MHTYDYESAALAAARAGIAQDGDALRAISAGCPDPARLLAELADFVGVKYVHDFRGDRASALSVFDHSLAVAA